MLKVSKYFKYTWLLILLKNYLAFIKITNKVIIRLDFFLTKQIITNKITLMLL